MQTKYAVGQRIRHREDGDTGRVHSINLDATPLYAIVWDHEPGEPALGSRHFADEIEAVVPAIRVHALCQTMS